jgi:hypothetical protein
VEDGDDCGHAADPAADFDESFGGSGGAAGDELVCATLEVAASGGIDAVVVHGICSQPRQRGACTLAGMAAHHAVFRAAFDCLPLRLQCRLCWRRLHFRGEAIKPQVAARDASGLSCVVAAEVECPEPPQRSEGSPG